LRLRFNKVEPDQESRWIDIGENLWPLQSQKGTDYDSFKEEDEIEETNCQESTLQEFLGRDTPKVPDPTGEA